MGTARVIQIETDLIVDGQSRRSVSTNCSIKLISCREKQVGREEPGYGASAVQLGGTINGQSVSPTKSRSMGKKLAKLGKTCSFAHIGGTRKMRKERPHDCQYSSLWSGTRGVNNCAEPQIIWRAS
jgi:hypothetical protein